MKRNFVSQQEVMDLLNVSYETLRRWNKCGILERIKIGGRNAYRIEDVERLMKGEKK